MKRTAVRWIVIGVLGAVVGTAIAYLAIHVSFAVSVLASVIAGIGAVFITARYTSSGLKRLTDHVEARKGKDLYLDETAYADPNQRRLVRALNSLGSEVNEIVGQALNRANGIVLVSKMLAEASERVSEHSDEQAAHTAELATAMEQMSATVHDIAGNAALTFEAATKMGEANRTGMQDMEKVEQGVDGVSELFVQVGTAMDKLRTASDDIGNVVQIIKDVAEQTNLLSLNAAIEAARAGDYGRGFAVVAAEVRTLAERTSESTLTISQSIEHNQRLTSEVLDISRRAQQMVEQSVADTRETMETLRSVAGGVDQVNDMIQQIASATEEQSATADHITGNIGHVSMLAQDSLLSAKGSHRASIGLGAYAGELEKRLSGFDLSYMGLVPLEDGIKMNGAFGPLCEFINSVLGRRLYIRLGYDYDDAIKDVGTGRALISYQTPSTYIEAHEKYGVVPLVVPLAKGEPFYKSAIVVRDDSGIADISQLSGKRFAFGDAKSTGSKAMPESMLKEAGIDIGALSEHAFLGSHDNVANAVLQKEYDGGGLMASVAEKYEKDGLKILAVSQPIPQFPICASPKLPAEEQERLAQALIALTDRQVLDAMGSGITGFAPIKDSDYDGVRTMLKNLAK